MNVSAGAHPLDLREAFRVLWRRRLLFLVPWAVVTLAGVCGAFLLRPVYTSSVTLMFERPQQLTGEPDGAAEEASTDAKADIMREQIRSSVFLQSVIIATGVRNDPETRGRALKLGKRLPGMSDEEVIERFLVNQLRDGITVRPGRGNVFRISVEDFDRGRARKLAAAVADQFVVVSKHSALEVVRTNQEFSLQQQQQIYKDRLEESERRLEEFQRNPAAASKIGPTVGEASVPRARTLLEQASIEVDDLRQRVALLSSRLAGRARENDPQLLTSPQTQTLEGEIGSLERQLVNAEVNETTLGSTATSVRLAIARKHTELEVEMSVNADRALPTLPPEVRRDLVEYRVTQADLAGVEGRRQWLADQVTAYRQNLRLAPEREIERQRLTETVEQNRQLYNSFLQQSVIAQIAEALENAKVSGRFVVLEPANRPVSPSKPNRPVLILLSALAGMVIGTATVLLVEHHDESMKNAEEVESLLGLPVLAAIPRVEELERLRRRARGGGAGVPGAPAPRDHGLLHRLKLESPLGLEFRRIYLKLKAGRTLPRSLVVTSATRGEGKTTITACLAITLARELRERVLLVDFDLRIPALHRALGLPSSSWGVAQVLAQGHFDERFVRATVLPNLDFLPAGRSQRPAAELIDDERVEWFLGEATRRYPMVILDSAPNLAVPDPLILGRLVEGVLYVVKAGSTIRKAAEYGVKVQREARDNVLGVLINDAGELLPAYFEYRNQYYGYSTEASGADS